MRFEHSSEAPTAMNHRANNQRIFSEERAR
jgi:hypothetical protein